MKKWWFVQKYVNLEKTNYRSGWELQIFNNKKDIPKRWFLMNETHVIGFLKAISEKEAIKKFIIRDKKFWGGLTTFYI